jgi:hypothetical protein
MNIRQTFRDSVVRRRLRRIIIDHLSHIQFKSRGSAVRHAVMRIPLFLYKYLKGFKCKPDKKLVKDALRDVLKEKT